jgi:hypothetical protein
MTRLPVLQPRSCGSCTACCSALQVKELDKGDYEPCKHLRRGSIKGCGIYKDRPEDCRVYQCLWLATDALGNTPDLRPDRCGFIMSSSVFKSEAMGVDEGFIMVHELNPGASHTPRAVALLSKLAEGVLVIEIMPDGIRKVRGGPPHLVERMMRIAQEMSEKGEPGYGLTRNEP